MMENTVHPNTNSNNNNSNNNNNNNSINNSSSNNIVIGSSRGGNIKDSNDNTSNSPISSNSSVPNNTPPLGTPLKPSTSMTSFTPTSSNSTFNENSLLFGMDDQIGMNSSPNGKFSSGSRNDFNRRRKQQSKSQSYSNFNNLLPELLKQEEELKSEQDYIMEFCLVLKERLKQLSIQLEYDLSEIEHKDQEIDLMKTKINKYNMELREKEEENETLQENIKSLEKENKEFKLEIENLRNEIKTFETDWIQPQEIFQWKEQIDKITFDMERKQQDLEDLELRYEASTKRIEILTDQIKKEREIHKEGNERVQQKIKSDREFNNSISNKLTKKKQKNLLLNEKIKKLQLDLERSHKNQVEMEQSHTSIIEKYKAQAQASEKEAIGLKHTVELLQQQLLESQNRYKDLSNSQKIINNQLAENEIESQAILGLVNKIELEGEENISILKQECMKLKLTITQLENQLNDERLTRQISSISLINNNYTLNQRELICKFQEKEEETERCNKQIQRLSIDNSSLKSKTKKLEENVLELSEQLKSTKELVSSYRKDIFRIKEELLLIWDDYFDYSIDNGNNTDDNENNNSQNNSINNSGQDLIVKRKSADISEITKILAENDQLFNSNDNVLSPIKTPTKQRSLSMRQPFSPISPTQSNSSFFSPNNKIIKNNNSNNISTPNKTLKEQTILEDMLNKSRKANLGYRFHIQVLEKEIKSHEHDLNQQKELSNSIISRLQLDLEDSKRQISRMKKTFLQRFSKEDDTLFLDYFSIFPHKSNGINNSNDSINNYSSSPNGFNYNNNNYSSSPSTSYGNTASAPASLFTTPSVGNTASSINNNITSNSSVSSLNSSFQSINLSQNLNNNLNSTSPMMSINNNNNNNNK